MKGVFITGTDTGVGKTWFSQKFIQALCAKGIDVVPRKPVESGWVDDVQQTDAGKLAQAAGKESQLDTICPNRFEDPVSPVRAAQLKNKRITLENLKEQCFYGIKKDQFLLLEGAGGFYSPLCSDGLNADLAETLGFPVILVVADKLGCINHALLTIEAIRRRQLDLVAVVLNHTSTAERQETNMDNLQDLKQLVKNTPVYPLAYNASGRETLNQLVHLLGVE